MNEYQSVIVFNFELVHEMILYLKLCHTINPYRVVLNLSWYSKVLNSHTESVFSFLSSSTLSFWSYQTLLTCKKSKRYLKAKINIIFHIRGVSFVPPTWVPEHLDFSVTEGRLSRNRRIKTEHYTFGWKVIPKSDIFRTESMRLKIHTHFLNVFICIFMFNRLFILSINSS